MLSKGACYPYYVRLTPPPVCLVCFLYEYFPRVIHCICYFLYIKWIWGLHYLSYCSWITLARYSCPMNIILLFHELFFAIFPWISHFWWISKLNSMNIGVKTINQKSVSHGNSSKKWLKNSIFIATFAMNIHLKYFLSDPSLYSHNFGVGCKQSAISKVDYIQTRLAPP